MRKAYITVPSSMSEETYMYLCEGILKRYGRNIEFIKTVDDSLLGGFILKLDGVVYDGSLKTQLFSLKKHLEA